MSPRPSHSLLWLSVSSLALLLSGLFRPLLPIDETRYLSVAWEMWQHAHYWVPHLNGEPYAHKPPLLFWLIQLGWAVFGVNTIWPRLIPPLFSLGALYLTFRLAQTLWPQHSRLHWQALWLTFGSLVWLLFFTLIQFDLLLVFFTLLGMLGLQRAAQGQRHGWWFLALALGFGILSKGPVIMLHLLPAALLAPIWAGPIDKRLWYGRLLSAVLAGIAIGLAWAIPAAIKGGEAYRQAIFWGQTAHRVVDSFAHQQPWWWYLPMLPVLLLPWSLWPRLWRTLPTLKMARTENGLRFLLCWIVPVLILFSLVSGKQLKYLLPLLPALTLVLAWVLQQDATKPRSSWGPGNTLLLAIGLVLLAIPHVPRPDTAIAWWLTKVAPHWGMLAVLSAFVLSRWPRMPADEIIRSALASVVAILLAGAALHDASGHAYDLQGISQEIRRLQAQRPALAYIGKYQGQFHYLGRLQHPIAAIPRHQAVQWAKQHPRGALIVNDKKQRFLGTLIYRQDYRSYPNSLKIIEAYDFSIRPRSREP